MRTVEVVKTWRGWHVTRRYCGRTMGTEFFSTIVPAKIKGKEKIKEYLEEVEAKKNNYITTWVGA